MIGFWSSDDDRLTRGSMVYVAVGATDLRKSINGLALLVEEQFELNLFGGSLFAFCNRRRDLVKILYWDGSGFCLWMKRLEQDCYRWPEDGEEVMAMSERALSWLLSGLDVSQAHGRLGYGSVS
ncbi:MAG: IS66 family insertion sequence element accessory protein TnpB [Desulfofustis sp. PB-SRB1]|nr:IS66 family insertion sequence element accessory protein TnpB [Desulfofustis sp. PB-SRB1]